LNLHHIQPQQQNLQPIMHSYNTLPNYTPQVNLTNFAILQNFIPPPLFMNVQPQQQNLQTIPYLIPNTNNTYIQPSQFQNNDEKYHTKDQSSHEFTKYKPYKKKYHKKY